MAQLISTVKGSTSNSYLSLALATDLLGQRLYTTKWDNAGTTPSADGYAVNDASPPTLGSTSVAVDSGTGTFTSGSKFTFASHTQLYKVSTALSGAGTLSFSPGLVEAIVDDEVVTRETLNEQEKSLVWATSLFDTMMEWKGIVRTTAQRLRWPRSGVYNPDGTIYDYDTIPEILEIATAEFALELLDRNRFKMPSILGQGVSEVRLGPLQAKVALNQGQAAAIPDNILALLSDLGTLESAAQQGTRQMNLFRS